MGKFKVGDKVKSLLHGVPGEEYTWETTPEMIGTISRDNTLDPNRSYDYYVLFPDAINMDCQGLVLRNEDELVLVTT